jgi:AcrR family transcriptional regulator
MPSSTRERNARGQGSLLRAEVLSAVDRLLGDDSRMRPKALALREVAREAGIAAPSIYQHFASKDELIEAAVAAGYRTLIDSMGAAAALCEGATSATAVLAAQAHAYCRFADEHRGFFRLMFNSAALIDTVDDSTGGATDLAEQWAQATSGLRDQGVKTELPPLELAMFVWSAVHGRIVLSRVLGSASVGAVGEFVDGLIAEILAVVS